MCIINDLFDLSVFYVYGSSVEFKRYYNTRYKAMNHFVKKKLHPFSRFAMKHVNGLVHEDYKNIFVNYKDDQRHAYVVAKQAITNAVVRD